MILGLLSLAFIWSICISICISIRLVILHIQNRDFIADEQPTQKTDDVVEQPTILSTPVQPKRLPRKRRKQQPAKVYFVMQQQEED